MGIEFSLISGRKSEGEWIRVGHGERYYGEGKEIPPELAYQDHPPIYYMERTRRQRVESSVAQMNQVGP